MNLKSIFLNTVGAVALAGMAVTAQAEFLEFVIDENSVPGTVSSALRTADKLNGGYTEVLTINADSSIDFVGVVNFTALFANEGVDPVGSFLNLPTELAPIGYNMYAIFQGSGTFTGGGFTISSSTFDLYLDPDQNTTFTFGATGADGVALGGSGEDYQIALATNLAIGNGIPGVPGAFLAIWDDFQLTSEGEAYFVSPRPFHLVVEATGDFDQNTFQPGTFQLTGDISAVFTPIPEPSTLALMGLTLLGLGAAARRRLAA